MPYVVAAAFGAEIHESRWPDLDSARTHTRDTLDQVITGDRLGTLTITDTTTGRTIHSWEGTASAIAPQLPRDDGYTDLTLF